MIILPVSRSSIFINMIRLTHIAIDAQLDHHYHNLLAESQNRILLENILHTLRDKMHSLLQNFKKRFAEQRKDLQGFGDLAIRYVMRKPLTAEEREKLQRNFMDILKMSGIVATFPIFGVSGNLLLSYLVRRVTQGRFDTLPTAFANNTMYTTDGIDTPNDPNM